MWGEEEGAGFHPPRKWGFWEGAGAPPRMVFICNYVLNRIGENQVIGKPQADKKCRVVCGGGSCSSMLDSKDSVGFS